MPARSRSKQPKQEEEDEGDTAAGEERPAVQRRRPSGLRDFIKTFEGKQHNVVEMRIAVVCGFGVALRILFLAEVPEKTVMSTFILIASELTIWQLHDRHTYVRPFDYVPPSCCSLLHSSDFLHVA